MNTNHYYSDEIFIEESFSTEPVRIKGSYTKNIFRLLKDSYQWSLGICMNQGPYSGYN